MKSEPSESTLPSAPYAWTRPLFDQLLALGRPDFIRRLFHHQLVPLYLRSGHSSLEELDSGSRINLEQFSQANTLCILTMISRFKAVARLLDGQNVRYAVYKGPALSHRLFGDVAVRQFGDIDLLVHPGDFFRTFQLLLDAGFKAKLPASPFIGAYLEQSRRDLTLGDAHLHLDLHQQIARGPRYYGLPEEFWNRLDAMKVYGQSYPTLPLELELVTLAVHASRHGWDHYKLVLDFAGLLLDGRAPDWNLIEGLIQRFQARTMFDLGVSLGRTLFADLAGPYRVRTAPGDLRRHLAVLNEGRSYTDMSMLRQFFKLQNGSLNRLKMGLFYLAYPRPEDPLLQRFSRPAAARILPLVHPFRSLWRALLRPTGQRFD